MISDELAAELGLWACPEEKKLDPENATYYSKLAAQQQKICDGYACYSVLAPVEVDTEKILPSEY
jgi:hypothetical protein